MPDNLPEGLLRVKQQAETFLSQVLEPLRNSAAINSEEAVREASKDAGFYFKTQPEAYGGSPAGALELTMLREMFAAANHPLTRCIFGPGPGVLHAADGLLRDHYLKPVLAGSKRGAFAYTEPDTAPRPTWGVLNDETVIVNGVKSYVTGGLTADFVSALVNVEHKDGTKAGGAMIVIDRDATGVSVDREFTSLDGSGHVSLTFKNVEVPRANIIGELGEGMPRALANIGHVRMMVSAQATGLCLFALEYIEAHLNKPHRSGSPLGEREGVRLRLADMRIETYVARSALYRTARLIEAGENVVNETAMIKVFTSETAGRVIDTAVQLFGGQALVTGHPLEKLYREVRSLRFVEGASDLLRLNIAKGRLDLDKGRV